MPNTISRRSFLRSAGGVTFLALTPIGRGLFAATEGQGAGLPLFTALPYIQPGNGSRLVESQEAVVVAWQTENKDAKFTLVYGPTKTYGQTAAITRMARLSGEETRLNYAANLQRLPLGHKVFYKVTCNERTVAEGYFTTRQPRGIRTRFAAIGDNACENIGNRNVAYQAYLTHPDFVVNVGDSVYNQGRDSEYTKYFFMVFNSDTAAPGVGAPLLRSVPYYSVLGNHDINFTDPVTKAGFSCANFDTDPGALGYYTNMYLPANGFKTPPNPTPLRGSQQRIEAFQKAAAGRYPQMANYSFDYGDVHFLCLDANIYIDTSNQEWQNWISADLKSTDARWKFVIHHQPAFNVGDAHFTEQQMRVLSPIFEANGVDFVLNGHEHIYQRSQPLHFAPTDTTKAANVNSADRLIPGTFTVDRKFDGQLVTKPDGVIYITTGAGGQNLHDTKMNNNPTEWTHQRDNNAAYVARVISDRHSFTLFDVGEEELTLTQVDENGLDIDRIRVTKS
ncbi:hypothetical protein IAD21_06366 [Abditibacteriota bacterium]|nr:hypothetical protein IAD21_06366 [Abditibacteriota bacterium]